MAAEMRAGRACRRLSLIREALAPAGAPAAAEEVEVVYPPTPGSDDAWAAEAYKTTQPLLGDATTGLSESQIAEWCSRGMVVLPEEQMGTPAGFHERLRETALDGGYGMYDFCDKLPIGELITAPGVESAVASLLGKDWAVVPFANGTAGGNKTGPPDGSPGGDQHWCAPPPAPLPPPLQSPPPALRSAAARHQAQGR